jgi:hypothetical protein
LHYTKYTSNSISPKGTPDEFTQKSLQLDTCRDF